MAFIPVPNTALVEIRMAQDNQKVENTLYFSKVDDWAAPSLTLLADFIIDWYTTNIAPLQGLGVTLTEVTATNLESSTGASVTRTPATPVEGGVGSPVLPNNVSLAISFRTIGRGRSSRGRNYFVGLTEGQVVGNEATSVFVTSLMEAYQLLLGEDAALTGATWSVVSRFIDKAPRVAGIAQPVISVVVTDPIIDSMRRRLPGRGN